MYAKKEGRSSNWRLHVTAGLLMLAIFWGTLAVYYQQHKKPSPASQTKTFAQSTNQAAAFGPVVERTVGNIATHETPELINLDTGELFYQSKVLGETAQLDAAQIAKKFRECGVDATGTLDPNTRGLAGWEMVALPVAASAWDHLKPMELCEALKDCQPGSPVVMQGTGALPATYLFRTREGGRGILQIIGFTDNPGGVKIRYKLVQNAAKLPATRDVEKSPLLQKSAAAFADLLIQGEFAKATAEFDEVMRAALPEAKLAEVWKQLDAAGGKFQGRDAPSRVEKIAGYTAVYVPCRWERNRVELKVVFNQAGKISGLWVAPPSPPAARPTP